MQDCLSHGQTIDDVRVAFSGRQEEVWTLGYLVSRFIEIIEGTRL